MGIENGMTTHNEKPRKPIVSGTFAVKKSKKNILLVEKKEEKLSKNRGFPLAVCIFISKFATN